MWLLTGDFVSVLLRARQHLVQAAQGIADVIMPPTCLYCRKMLAVHDALAALAGGRQVHPSAGV